MSPWSQVSTVEKPKESPKKRQDVATESSWGKDYKAGLDRHFFF